MAERRLNVLIASAVVLLGMAVLWDLFNGRRPARPADPLAGETLVVTTTTEAPPPNQGGSQGAAVPPTEQTHYMDMLARAETRRQIRASAQYTYLNEILAASADSMLHRWDNRINDPVRVWLPTSTTTANYQPAFRDAIRTAFNRWQEQGVPVRFDMVSDSESAEVVFKWRVQFEIERTGQTDLTWDQDGHLQSGVVTLATFNQLGQAMGPDDIRVVALHEIGHLIGLDHSPDSTDLMFPVARVRDLSDRDVQTALLLYRLSPGSVR